MEGRGSAILAVVVAMVIVSAMAPGAFAANHLVGGTTQTWNYPPSNDATYYDGTWAPSQTFRVGDTLQFQYTQNHDVVQYGTKAEYDACAGTQVAKWTTGNDTILLSATGVYYYICSIPGHCTEGMKVSVSVTAAAVPPASPPTTTTPSPPATGTPPGTTSPPPPPTNTNGATSGPVLSILCLVVSAVLAACAAFLAG